MSSEYEDMSLEELQKLKEEREKQELIAKLTAEDTAKQEAEEKARYEEIKAKAREELLNEGALAAEPKLIPDPNMSKKADSNKYANWLYKFTGGKITPYEQTFNFDSPADDDPSDTDCNVDVSSWSPADVYVNAIWHTMFESVNLLKLAVPGLNVNAGDGMSVQIRAITRSSKDDITTTATPCDCISCTSTSFNTYTLTISQHGISREICDYDIWDVGERYRSEYLKDLGQVWAEFFDWQIYNELNTATPGYSESIATSDPVVAGSCCTDAGLTAVYYAVDNLITRMRANYYKPDYMIMHPRMAAYFRRMQTPSPIFGDAIELGKNGALKSILGVEVIEYNAAPDPSSSASGEELIVVIDSRRAVGAAFGKKPKMESDRNIDCNSTTYAMWCFFGAAELDTNAIGHVVVA